MWIIHWRFSRGISLYLQCIINIGKYTLYIEDICREIFLRHNIHYRLEIYIYFDYTLEIYVYADCTLETYVYVSLYMFMLIIHWRYMFIFPLVDYILDI